MSLFLWCYSSQNDTDEQFLPKFGLFLGHLIDLFCQSPLGKNKPMQKMDV
jgi:hypothetical protein